MLKIPDGSAQEHQQSGVCKTPKCSNNSQKENKALDTPPLVQQMFDVNTYFNTYLLFKYCFTF